MLQIPYKHFKRCYCVFGGFFHTKKSLSPPGETCAAAGASLLSGSCLSTEVFNGSDQWLMKPGCCLCVGPGPHLDSRLPSGGTGCSSAVFTLLMGLCSVVAGQVGPICFFVLPLGSIHFFLAGTKWLLQYHPDHFIVFLSVQSLVA